MEYTTLTDKSKNLPNDKFGGEFYNETEHQLVIKLYDKLDCVYQALNELTFLNIPYEYKKKVSEVIKNLLNKFDEINKGGNND